MKLTCQALFVALFHYGLVSATHSETFASVRNVEGSHSLVVDLGYARYQGYLDSNTHLRVWKGVRYAAPPVGQLRWQSPQTPASNRTRILQANSQPPLCPQSGAAKTPDVYGFLSGPGDEDCLFLNIYAPPNARDLPVFFWIHGGGYGDFGATQDPSPLMNINSDGFVSVIIQYRLGAFGFLSSKAVHQYGKVNAGLLDQNFALQWVQKHIQKFGGDPSRVTVAGESAGAGAVMLQAMAYGGEKKATLFDNLFAASPYLPPQYNYADAVPTQNYDAFAKLAGCSGGSKAVFKCLVNAKTEVLQNASGKVSQSGVFGSFAFVPVTDGEFVQSRPSEQLLAKKVQGKRILVGNNANEGVPLSDPTIETAADFRNYIHLNFPRFTPADIARLLRIYRFEPSPVNRLAPLFDTLGDRGPTALNQSEFATGLQQKVFNIYSETTFTCPSYWLAEAFSSPPSGRDSSSPNTRIQKQSWKYQYSVTPAFHGADLTAYFSLDATTPTKGFIHAFSKILGNFIINNTPVISISDAKANARNATVPLGRGGKIDWPVYSARAPIQMNLNTTGGSITQVNVTEDLQFFVRSDPGVTNEFRLVNANTWEGGRGARCEFWRDVGARVPE